MLSDESALLVCLFLNMKLVSYSHYLTTLIRFEALNECKRLIWLKSRHQLDFTTIIYYNFA